MRQDVNFHGQGLVCRGWLYTPDGLGPDQKAPAVVMAHAFSAVKEMALPFFAERFAAAGLVTLVFDFRQHGESEGEPRRQIFPLEQEADCRNAVTWLSEHQQVDRERIGLWGTSFSGGVALHATTFDSRVKAVVAQVPSAVNYEGRRSITPERFDRLGELLLRDRIARYRTGVVNYLKVVAPEGEPSALPTPNSYEWFLRQATLAPTWQNQVTLESMEKIREFDPFSLLHLISPRASLLIAGEHDTLVPLALVKSAHQRLGEPKGLVVLPCGHFDVYEGHWGERTVEAEIKWFRRYLQAARDSRPPSPEDVLAVAG